MKHLIKYEEYNAFTDGDIVKVFWNGQEHFAKIKSKKSNNSYIVLIQHNNKFLDKGVAVTGDDILGRVEGLDTPAEGDEWVKAKYNKSSNDMVINNYPSNDGGGASVYNIETSGQLGVGGPN